MQLEDFPKSIRDLGLLFYEHKRQLTEVETALKFRKAHIQIFGTFESPVTRRDPELVLKLAEDQEYTGLLNKEKDLRERLGKLEWDLGYLKDSFAVEKLRLKEKLNNNADED